MPLSIPNLIVNDTAANAIPVNDNFVAIQTQSNEQFINKDGSLAMDQPLVLSAVAPSADRHAVRLVDLTGGGALALPPGMISDFGGVTAPTGWLLCDGSEVSTVTYASLYAVIGERFAEEGDDEGDTQFRLPNFTDRSAIGPGSLGDVGDTGGSPDTVVAQHNHGWGTLNVATSVDHNHPAKTVSFTESGGHQHTSVTGGTDNDIHTHNPLGDLSINFLYRMSGAGDGQNEITVGTGTGLRIFYGSTVVTNDSHNHALSGVTAWSADSEHTHSATVDLDNYDVAARTGAITGVMSNEGTLDANTNYHPYVVVTKIIRAV